MVDTTSYILQTKGIQANWASSIVQTLLIYLATAEVLPRSQAT